MIGFNTSLGKFGKYASVKIDSIMPVLGMEQNIDKDKIDDIDNHDDGDDDDDVGQL